MNYNLTLIDIYHKNLQYLRQQRSIYGAGEVPLRITNEIAIVEKNIANLEDELKRRLQALMLQAAKYGIAADPHIQLEIEDINKYFENHPQAVVEERKVARPKVTGGKVASAEDTYDFFSEFNFRAPNSYVGSPFERLWQEHLEARITLRDFMLPLRDLGKMRVVQFENNAELEKYLRSIPEVQNGDFITTLSGVLRHLLFDGKIVGYFHMSDDLFAVAIKE